MLRCLGCGVMVLPWWFVVCCIVLRVLGFGMVIYVGDLMLAN